MRSGTLGGYERTPWLAPSGSTHTSEIPSDVAQVRPLLLQDHANAVTDARMPVTAAPRVLAFLREQLRGGRGQEVVPQPLPLGTHREDLLVHRRVHAEDRHVEAHLAGTGEDLADLVERLLDLDAPAGPGGGGGQEGGEGGGGGA